MLIDNSPRPRCGWVVYHPNAPRELFFQNAEGRPSRGLVKQMKKRLAKAFNVPLDEVVCERVEKGKPYV